MDDDRLRRELERRATRAAVPDFVSEVAPRLDSDRAQPARVAPWAPLAGLAGAAFLVVLLVIAWPRFGTGPASTKSPATSGSGTHNCGSVTNQVYESTPVYVVDSTGSVLSCAAEHRNNYLLRPDGTVTVGQVPGEPDQLDVDWVTQECRPERVLLDIKHNDAGYALRVVVDRTGPDGYECVSTLQTGHAIVTLSKSVDAATVSSELALAPDAAADLPKTVDCAALAGSSARVPTLVDHTGLVVGCSEVEAGFVSSGRVDATNPTDFDSVRYRWLDQTCAGPAAADFEAVYGGYRLAVAMPSSTCWPGVPVAIVLDYQIPMPAQLVTADYAQPAPVLSCADAPLVTIVDEVGAVSSCAASQSAGTVTAADGVLIDNPGGDATALRLSWMEPTGSQCTYEVHLSKPGDGYSVRIINTSSACPGTGAAHTVTLELSTPIPADQVTFWSIGGPPVSPSHSPTPTSQPAPLPSGNQLDCGADWGLVLNDLTGLVASCDLNVYDQSWKSGFVVSASEISASWYQPMCSGDLSASFQKVDGGYLLSIDEQPLALPTPGQKCPGGLEPLTLTLSLSSPVPPNLSVTVKGQQLPDMSAPSPSPDAPLPTGAELSCGNDGTLVDATSLVDACRLDRGLQFDSPDGLTSTPTQITATWVVSMCQAVIHASLVKAVDGYELDITPQSFLNSGAVPSCAGGPVKMTLTLFLRSPLDGQVSAKFGDQDLPNLAAPSPT